MGVRFGGSPFVLRSALLIMVASAVVAFVRGSAQGLSPRASLSLIDLRLALAAWAICVAAYYAFFAVRRWRRK
jgi:hypothetical protein